MPPSRKRRSDRVQDEEPRPSPYRPDDSDLGRESSQHVHSHNRASPQGSRVYSSNTQGASRGARRGGRNGGPFRSQPSQTPAESLSTRDSFDGDQSLSHNSGLSVTPRTGSPAPADPTPRTSQPAAPAGENPQSMVASQPTEQVIRDPNEPYAYEFLTDEHMSQWTTDGKEALVQLLANELASEDYMRISQIFQELIHAGTSDRIDAEEAGAVIKAALAAAPAGQIDGEMLFLESFSAVFEFDQKHPKLRPLLLSTGIPADKVRENLESTTLETLGIVRSHFQRIQTRKQTNILYRQANYNLLREETEGYSKLVTALFDIASMKETPGNIAEETFEKVLALIGSFNLDAGRVLDVTLDLFATLLVRHFRFFVKYLRASQYWPSDRSPEGLVVRADPLGNLPFWAQPGSEAWITTPEKKDQLNRLRTKRDANFWARARQIGVDAFFELGGRRVLEPDDLSHALELDGEADDQRALETRKWIEHTKTLPPRGNPVAAQLLGFKLRFYSTPGRSATDVLPEILIFLAALLIKIGFISLRDLYTHLYPDDESMEGVREIKIKEKEERDAARRGGGVQNALTKAGALVDDTAPPPAMPSREADNRSATTSKADLEKPTQNEGDAKEAVPEPADQKIELLKSLLLQGALPEALYLLGRFPWLYDLVPDLAKYFNRILHHCLSHICEPLVPLSNPEKINQTVTAASGDQSGLPRNGLRISEIGPRRTLKWARLDARHGGDNGADYSFYFEEWADSVPICQTVDDVFTLCQTLLGFSGPKIGEDEVLLQKLVRIGKWSLDQDKSDANHLRWVDLLKRIICPAFSLTKGNTNLSVDLFDLLSHFSTQVRYAVYSEWFQGAASRQADVSLAFKQAESRTKSLMKRMSTTNVEEMAQAIAKVACSNPGAVFNYALTQIESYNNLANVVIDCGQYFTEMSFDVFAWAIVSTLGRTGRNKVTGNGFEASSWLISLSSFIGKIFERYDNMPTLPILLYVFKSLRKDEFMDLRVLKELIIHMAGIIPEADLSDFQTRCLAGGTALRSYTLRRIQDVRHLKQSSAERLTSSFTNNALTGQFVVAIARTRQASVARPDQATLKVVSENFDDIHIVLGQFLELLNSNLTVENLYNQIPSLVALIQDHGIDPSIAFLIHRRAIAHSMQQHDAQHRSLNKDNDVQMAGVEEENPVASRSAIVLKSLSESLLPVLGEDLEATINLAFYTTFWSLSVNDVFFDQNSYDTTLRLTKERIDEIGRELTRLGSTEAKRRAQLEPERAYLNKTRTAMQEEMKQELQHCESIVEWLRSQKGQWFKDRRGNFRVLLESIWQQCFLPRLLLSPLDAYYCWKMFWFLHSEGVTGFSTMHFLSSLFSPKTLESLMFSCTAREAENLGRFAYQILRKLAEWQASERLYCKEAHGANEELVGFARGIKDGKPERLVTFIEFRNLHYTWHRQIFEAMSSCLQPQGEYMHMKNAISFVKSIGEVWPRVDLMGTKLHDVAISLAENEKPSSKDNPGVGLERGDLSVALASLQATLARSRSKWIPQKEFRTGERPPPKETLASGPSRVTRNSPRPDPSRQRLDQNRPMNAEATSFQPQGSAASTTAINTKVSNSDDRTASTSAKTDVEDGELADSPVVGKPSAADPAPHLSMEELKQKALASMSSKHQRDNNSSPAQRREAGEHTSEGPAVDKDAGVRSNRPEIRRQPLPPQRPPPSGPADRFGDYVRGRPGDGAPVRRPYPDNRPELRSRPYGEMDMRGPRPDIMADRERASAGMGRLPAAGVQDRPPMPRVDDYRNDGSRLPDRRDARPYADERARHSLRGEGRHDVAHEQASGAERQARFDERRESGRRSSPRPLGNEGGRHGAGMDTVHDTNSLNPERAMMMEQSATGPYRDTFADSKAPPPLRSRQHTPPGAHTEPRFSSRDDLYDQMRPPPFDSGRDRLPPSDFVPNGPRGAAGRAGPRPGYDMDSTRGPLGPRAGAEPGHGMRYLEPTGPRHQDPNYGRLTREPVEGAGGRGPRGYGGPPSDREDYGGNGGAHPANASASSSMGRRTSDRFGPGPAPSTPEASTMHPSRMRHFDSTNDTRGGSAPRVQTGGFPDAPSGPRMGAQTPTQASPAGGGMGASSGPGTSGSDRRENQRRYAGLQDTLAQGTPGPAGRRGESGGSLRGRGTPMNGGAEYGRGLHATGPAGDGRGMYDNTRRDDGRGLRRGRDERDDRSLAPPPPPHPARGYRDGPGGSMGREQMMDEGDGGIGGSGRKRAYNNAGEGSGDAERGKRIRRGGGYGGA